MSLSMATKGTFDVSLEPQHGDAAPVGRMLIDKRYVGGIQGKGLGQMISKRTESGSAVYSAIEEFKGSVDGKEGAFTLVHFGEMSAAGQSLEIKIVADSGQGELEGIFGQMMISQEDGVHLYVLEYGF